MKISVYLLFFYFNFISVFAQKYNSEVLNEDLQYQILDNKLVLNKTVTIQINNRQGDRDADIAIYYNKKDKINIWFAQIEGVGGEVIRVLKKSEIDDVNAYSNSYLYSDEYVKSFNLKHNEYPYRVTYSYQIQFANFLYIASWGINPNSKRPIRNATLSVTQPIDYPIKYSSKNISEPIIETSEKNKKYTWSMSYIPQEYEIFVDEDCLQLPEIKVLPLNFKYGEVGRWQDWASFGQWMGRLNKDLLELPDDEKKRIDILLKDINVPIEKAKVLYEYLQKQTRYINIPINLGGLRSYSANYVSMNKYGDCKALSTYMIALLAYANIPAYYTLIEAGDNPSKIDKQFASQAFNHVIVTIPFAQDTTFLECTDKNSPFGYLGTFTQGREAFVIDGNKSFFINTPTLSEKDVLVERIIDATGSNGIVKIRSVERGEDFDYLLSIASNYKKSTLEKFIKDKNLFTGSMQLDDFSMSNIQDDFPEIELSAVFQIQNVLKRFGESLVLAPFPLYIPKFESPTQRTKGVKIDVPIAKKDFIMYNLNESIDTRFKLPQPIKFSSKYGIYKIDYRVENGTLYVEKEIIVHKGIYPIEEYDQFFNFINFIKNNELKNIYLEII